MYYYLKVKLLSGYIVCLHNVKKMVNLGSNLVDAIILQVAAVILLSPETM
jgi:hypothetical protein